MKLNNVILLFFVIIMGSSCTSYKSLLNYSDSPKVPINPQSITNFKPIVIQSNDILRIRISSVNADAVRPFVISGSEEKSAASGGFDEFLVSSDGYIDFPTIGRIELSGLTIEETKAKILQKLTPFFTHSPIVQVRLINFRVNVNGEVRRPGSFTVYNDRLTIIEAITLAGDFTPYSSRDSILIIREENNTRTFGYIDFNSYEVFSSPYFYLQQNDVIYIRPKKAKINEVRDPASRVLPWVTAGFSLVALIFSISR
ncbi:MAG: polysaccharide biosynthesis/export family protein [Saprospiraceae bacterium]